MNILKRFSEAGADLPASLAAAARHPLCRPILLALVLRLAVTPFNQIEGLLNPDHLFCWEYGNVARALVAGHGFGSPFVSAQPSAIMPPLFSLVVAACFWLFGVHTPGAIFAVHAFNCVLSALTCIPIFLVARRSFGERTGRIAAWSWALFPYGIYFAAAWAWSTHILLFCLCWLFWLAQQMEESSSWKLWAGFGLLAGVAGLAEPSALAVAPLLLLFAAFKRHRSGGRWLVPGLVAAVALAAAISPWIVRNALVFHRFIPMRDSMGLEMWMGNNGQTVRWTDDTHHPLHDAQELAAYNQMGELNYMAWKSQQASAYIHAHPGLYALTSARRWLYLWTGYWSLDPRYVAEEPFALANIPFATALTLLGLSGLAFLWSEQRGEAVRYALVLLAYPLLYTMAHPEPYHMRALDPLLLALSCHGVLRAQAWLTQPQIAAEDVAGEVLTANSEA